MSDSVKKYYEMVESGEIKPAKPIKTNKMKKQLLTDDIIIEKLETNGFMEEPDPQWILEYIESEYDGKLNNEKSWAEGHEDRIIYCQTTADSYEVYISTDSHDDKNIYFEQDVYYYVDSSQFADDIIDCMVNGGDAWCDPSVWDDIEYEFNDALGQWWSDVWDELYDEKKDELIDSEEYELEKED